MLVGSHRLCCPKPAGRRLRHSAVNSLLHRALCSAQMPSKLEPAGLCRSDNKRPDGATLVPWSKGKPALRDFTCSHTTAPSNVRQASARSCAVAEEREKRKSALYRDLTSSHHFFPVAVETLGGFGPAAVSFVKGIGSRLEASSGDPRATQFLVQSISVAVQKGNALCVTGSIGAVSDGLSDALDCYSIVS